MKTLAQMRNSQLLKLNKKRKLDLSSLVMTSRSNLLKSCHRNRKDESTGKNIFKKKETSKDQQRGCLKIQKREGGRALCDDKGNNDLQIQNLKRRRRHKKKRTTTVLDETSHLQRRARYLLIKIKLEQNLIEAYSGEGWKGQSREKIKPERELLRAEKQIVKCKLGLRDIIQQLDLLGSIGQIDNSLVAPDGSVHHEHIFCKKCKSQEASEDNDIILCDGTCNCAFHQKCHDPPLATEDIPPEDEGWLCKYCDSKMEILEAINAHLGTIFSFDSTWQDIFEEEAHLSETGTRDFNQEEEWPDDESDDNDYNPYRGETDSASRSSADDRNSNGESSSSSLCCSLESEVFSGCEFSSKKNRISCNLSQLHPDCDSNDHEVVNGPRQRSAVDYRKLYDEMFGKETTRDDLFSEDEDWGPNRKAWKEKKSHAATTLTNICESEAAQSTAVEMGEDQLPISEARKRLSRMPNDVAEKLREAFAENELPSRAFKKEISVLVGLEYEKVNKWFRNARYLALKTRKQAKRTSHCLALDESDCKADKSSCADVSLSSTSSPTSTHEDTRLKKVTWDSNLSSLLSPLKRHRVKKSLPAKAKANAELSDDVSLNKHLLHLKTKKWQQKTTDNEDLRAQSVEVHIQRFCQAEEKIQKLKHILSIIQKPKNSESNEPSSKQYVVYVPVAQLKEKL